MRLAEYFFGQAKFSGARRDHVYGVYKFVVSRLISVYYTHRGQERREAHEEPRSDPATGARRVVPSRNQGQSPPLQAPQ
ncbi:hypothetical protein D3C78_1903160 [compost metagenome]